MANCHCQKILHMGFHNLTLCVDVEHCQKQLNQHMKYFLTMTIRRGKSGLMSGQNINELKNVNLQDKLTTLTASIKDSFDEIVKLYQFSLIT